MPCSPSLPAGEMAASSRAAIPRRPSAPAGLGLQDIGRSGLCLRSAPAIMSCLLLLRSRSWDSPLSRAVIGGGSGERDSGAPGHCVPVSGSCLASAVRSIPSASSPAGVACSPKLELKGCWKGERKQSCPRPFRAQRVGECLFPMAEAMGFVTAPPHLKETQPPRRQGAKNSPRPYFLLPWRNPWRLRDLAVFSGCIKDKLFGYNVPSALSALKFRVS